MNEAELVEQELRWQHLINSVVQEAMTKKSEEGAELNAFEKAVFIKFKLEAAGLTVQDVAGKITRLKIQRMLSSNLKKKQVYTHAMTQWKKIADILAIPVKNGDILPVEIPPDSPVKEGEDVTVP